MFFIPLILFIFLTQSTSLSFVDPIFFSFASFGPESCGPGGDLICSGAATISDHGYVDLTHDPRAAANATVAPALVKNEGRILYMLSMLAWPASFMTTFVVRIARDPNSIDSISGDGLAFIMAEDNGPCPSNSYGPFLGLFNQTTQGTSSHLLAVELDTFMNEFDPNGNHVGVDTRSILSDATANLDNTGVNLTVGQDVKVKIVYDGWKKDLEVLVAYNGDPLVSVLNHSIIMEETVPQSVFVGFTASTSRSFETHQIINWAFTTLPLPNYSLKGQSSNNKSRKFFVIAIPVGLGFLVLVWYSIRKGKCSKRDDKVIRRDDIESRSREAVHAPKMFAFKQLSRATNNFSEHNLLGMGGFGSVYRGDISEPPFTVAVKRISATSLQGEREYFAEICTIGRLRHKNLVQLQGWCHQRKHLLLVYEFMANGSLDRFISKGFLDWPTRYKVITGLASALLYLHEECGNTVIHRDVKPNNVLLDTSYNARLGDFGLARLLENESEITTMIAGTPGYVAPECSYTGKATTDSDVFSFGIVTLEVACGRRSIGRLEHENSLVDHMWELYGKGQLIQGVDPRLEDKFDEEQMERVLVVGLSCSHPDPRMRPTMRKVLQSFTNPNEPLMELPESRPTAIYVPVLSPSASPRASPTNANTSFAMSQVSISDTSLQYGR